MRGEVNGAKFASTVLDALHVAARNGIADRTRAEQVFESLLAGDESLAFIDRLATHVFEYRLDGSHLVFSKLDLYAHFQQMCRPRNAIEFGYLGHPPAVATAKFTDIRIGEAFDGTSCLPDYGDE